MKVDIFNTDKKYNIIYIIANGWMPMPPTAERRMIMWTVFWEYLRQQKPKTNADRIREMSDEELSIVLNAFSEYFDECNRSYSDVKCNDCELYKLCSLNCGDALKWLKQPAEEE